MYGVAAEYERAGSWQHKFEVVSTRATGTLPAVDWEESITADDRKVTSRLTLQVADPRADLADTLDAPLAWAGQKIAVRAGWDAPNAPLMLPMGRWRVTKSGAPSPTWVKYPTGWITRGGVLKPEADDLLTALDDDLPWLTGPRIGSTIYEEVARLVEGRIPVAKTWPGVDSGAWAPYGQVYQDNRLTAICDLLATVHAVAWVNRAGAFQPLPLSHAGVDAELSAADIVSRTIGGDRSAIYNRVIVTGTDPTDNSEIRVWADEATGPFRVDGPFGVATKTIQSPISSNAVGASFVSMQRMANTELQNLIDGRSVRVQITLATPLWHLDPLDNIRFTDPTGRGFEGPVTSIDRGSSKQMEIEIAVPLEEVWVNG